MTTRAARRRDALPALDPRRQAYEMAAVALRDLGRPDEELAQLAERCGMDAPMAMEPYRAYGGATSFDELTTYLRGETRRSEYDQLNWQLRGIMDNILNAEGMTDADRASRITQLADDFATRAAAIPAIADAEVAESIGLDDPDDLDEVNEGEADDTPRGTWWKRQRAQAKAKTPAPSPIEATSSFVAMREGPNWRWLSAYSNKYYDNFKEVFSEASHERFLKWADEDPPNRYPELWDWHTPVGAGQFGLKEANKLGMGRADFLDYQDGIAIAGGYFYPEFSDAAEALSKTPNLGTSHGFGWLPWDFDAKDASYQNHLTFEISPLPRDRAANFGTTFLADLGLKEDSAMQFRPDRRAFLVGIHGELKVKAMERALGEHAQGMKESGIDFKDVDWSAALDAPSAPPAATPPAADPTPAPTPAADPTTGQRDDAAAAITAAVTAAIQPLATAVQAVSTRLAEVEARDFRPRVQAPPVTPSTDPSNIVRGNSSMVIAAKDGARGEPISVPPHLARYARGVGYAIATDNEPNTPSAPPADVASAAGAAATV